MLVDVDGRKFGVARAGDRLRIERSPLPLWTFCATDPVSDWLTDLNGVLNWSQPPSRRESGEPIGREAANRGEGSASSDYLFVGH